MISIHTSLQLMFMYNTKQLCFHDFQKKKKDFTQTFCVSAAQTRLGYLNAVLQVNERVFLNTWMFWHSDPFHILVFGGTDKSHYSLNSPAHSEQICNKPSVCFNFTLVFLEVDLMEKKKVFCCVVSLCQAFASCCSVLEIYAV